MRDNPYKSALVAMFCFVPLTLFSQFTWPNGKKCAVVLTYDDALDSQLETAIPQLDRYGFKGTFYLTGTLKRRTVPQWRSAASHGHELGNHTVFHPCSENVLPNLDPRYHSEHYTAELIIDEISALNTFLYALDGKTERTFAYPCAETVVGGKDYVAALAESGLVRYARLGDDGSAVITDPHPLNPLRIPSRSTGNNPSGEQLTAFAEEVLKNKGLGIFTFHGVGGDYLSVSTEAHQVLLEYLNKHAPEIWVATFQEVMDYIFQRSIPKYSINSTAAALPARFAPIVDAEGP